TRRKSPCRPCSVFVWSSEYRDRRLENQGENSFAIETDWVVIFTRTTVAVRPRCGQKRAGAANRTQKAPAVTNGESPPGRGDKLKGLHSFWEYPAKFAGSHFWHGVV